MDSKYSYLLYLVKKNVEKRGNYGKADFKLTDYELRSLSISSRSDLKLLSTSK